MARGSSLPTGLVVSFTAMSDPDLTALRFAGVLLALSKQRPDDRMAETVVGP